MAHLGTSLKLLPDNCFNYFVIDEDSPADAMTDEGCRPYVERTLGRLEAHVKGLFDSDIIGNVCWGPVTLKPGCMVTSGQAEGLGIGSRASFGRHARSISADFDDAPRSDDGSDRQSIKKPRTMHTADGEIQQPSPPSTPPPTVPRTAEMVLSTSMDQQTSTLRPRPPSTLQPMTSSPRNVLIIGLSRHAGTSQPLPPLPLDQQPPICTAGGSATLDSAGGAGGSVTLDSAGGSVLPHGAGSRSRSNSSTTPINRTGQSLPVAAAAAASLPSVFYKFKAQSDDAYYYRLRFTEATSQGTEAIYKPCGVKTNEEDVYKDPESTPYRQNAIKRYCGSADSWKREIGYCLNEATESPNQQVFACYCHFSI